MINGRRNGLRFLTNMVKKRFLISIIHVASNQQSITDRDFANGFDRIAEEIMKRTGVAIGFALDNITAQ